MKDVYIPFYPRDWLSETSLRLLSSTDRGIWFDLICLMAMAEPYGHLATQGRPLGTAEIAKLIGEDKAILQATLGRLLDAGVCSKNCDGMIYCRRLVKDYAYRQQQREFGKKATQQSLSPVSLSSKSEDLIQSNPYPDPIQSSLPATLGGSLGGGSTPKKHTEPPDFIRFWNAYPRKQGRKKALKAWFNAKDKPKIEPLLNSIELQMNSEQWQRENGQFIPLPATWLNQGRWSDEINSSYKTIFGMPETQN